MAQIELEKCGLSGSVKIIADQHFLYPCLTTGLSIYIDQTGLDDTQDDDDELDDTQNYDDELDDTQYDDDELDDTQYDDDELDDTKQE